MKGINIRTNFSRALYGIILIFAIMMVSGSPIIDAESLSESQIQTFDSNILYFNTCTSPGVGGSSLVGTGLPNSAQFPDLNPSAMANAINEYIASTNSSSKLGGLGATIVADGQHSNINPFLIVAIAQHESSLASPSDYNVINGNNAFGRTAAPGQPSFQGATTWYYWSSVEASVDYTAPENQGKAYGGDMASYLRVRFASEIDSSSLLSVFEAYAPLKAGNSPVEYTNAVEQTIGQLVSLTDGASNSPTSTSSSLINPSSNYNCAVSPNCNNNTGSSALDTLRQNVVCIAEAELATWQSQPGYPWNGANTYSETGYLKYSEGRAEEWCADFVSWVYNQANYPLAPDPNWDLPAVSEIQATGELNQGFQWHPSDSGYSPQPGDIAIYIDPKSGTDGHANIVVSVSNGQIQYIGGDQGNGPYPGGSIVSLVTSSGPYDNGIIGYVSPN